MNIELITTTDDSAEVRQMISAWTDSLLRQRSRPVRVPQRGEWLFASPSARPQPRFRVEAAALEATLPTA